MTLNTQSLGNKTLDVCDQIVQGNYDVVFLTETWFQPKGSEPDIAAVTPRGFTLKSFPRQHRSGGGIAVLYRNSLKQHLSFSTKVFSFTAFEVCEVRLDFAGQNYVFLCVYRPPPSAKNKLTRAMFLDQFPDLLEAYITHERLFVVGDINVHFDNPSDHSTVALKALLENLGLEQLITVPTQRKGHTLDWLITNCVTDVKDLSVCDMMLSDHFVISFELDLRKPCKAKKNIASRNLKAINMHAFKTDARAILEPVSQDSSSDPISAYDTGLRQLLDQHAPLKSRTVSDRTSAP